MTLEQLLTGRCSMILIDDFIKVRSSLPEVFYRKGILKTFATFTGKSPVLESLLMKLQVFSLQLY